MTKGGVGRTGSRRIAIAAPHSRELVTDDLPLVKSLIADGHFVLCISPVVSESDELALGQVGAKVAEIDITADKFALMPERQVAKRISMVLTQWNADTVLVHGNELIAPVAVAAKKSRLPRIIVVQAGMSETGDEVKDVKKPGTEKFIKAFDAATAILCTNYDHAAQLEDSGLLREGLSPIVLPWSGVDLKSVEISPLPAVGRGLSVLMVSELSRSHGALALCEAAAIVRERSPLTTFHIAGHAGRAEDALTAADLARYADAVTYLGDGADLGELIARCHVFAYPSWAGTSPGPAIEAMAMGRPLIVADAPGCRELVDERVNGCLCRAGDARSLADAIESYLKRPDLIPSMARASRQKAERRYDRRLVMAALFDVLEIERAKAGAV